MSGCPGYYDNCACWKCNQREKETDSAAHVIRSFYWLQKQEITYEEYLKLSTMLNADYMLVSYPDHGDRPLLEPPVIRYYRVPIPLYGGTQPKTN